jgi:hypothetical protein
MSHGIVKVLFTTIAAVGLLAPAAVAGVDPGLLALVQPDAKMLVGIQVTQTQSSPLGQYLLSQVQLDSTANKVMTAAGFDPRRDVREILAASGDSFAGVLLGRGTFQTAKISKAAVQAGAVSSTYRGTEILTLKNSGDAKNKLAGSIAFLDASTMAAGDTDAVKAVIDRHAGGSDRRALSVELAERARQISAVNDAWLASLTPPSAVSGAAKNSQLGPFENLLQAALQLSAGLKFAATQVTLSAEVLTRTAQDAQSMADVLKFFAGMLQQAGNSGPNASPNAAKMPSFADATKISTTGPVLHLTISVPEQQMEQIIMPDSRQPGSGQTKKGEGR